MIVSSHVQTVALLPGAGAGEGVAVCAGRRVVAATRGQPCLCKGMSTVGKVGEGADPGSVGVVQLHRSADTVFGLTSRYQDH